MDVTSYERLNKFRLALRDDRELPADVKLVLFILSTHYPDIRPGYALLAKECDRSARHLKRCIGVALHSEWLVCTFNGAGHKAAEYRLRIP